MLIPMSHSAFMMVVCLVVTLLSRVRSKQQVPNVVDHMHHRLKRADPEKRLFRVALRSYLDNRIDTLPPPDPDYFSYRRHQNQLPYAPSFHNPSKSHNHRPKPRHRRPEVTPHFGLDLPTDFLTQNLPSILDEEKSPHGFFDKPRSRPIRPSPQKTPGLFGSPDDHSSKSLPKLFSKLPLNKSKSSPSLLSKIPLPSLSLQPLTSDEGEGRMEKTDSTEDFPALDPFFLSGIDLDNPPEEEASLGNAALAGLMGSLLPGDSLAVDPHRAPVAPSGMDKEADDIMEEFLTFLDLKASGALDKCLKKKSLKAED